MRDFVPMDRRQALAGLASLSLGLGLADLGGATARADDAAGSVITMFFVTEPTALLSLVNTSAVGFSARTTEGLLSFDKDLNPHPLLATEWSVAEDGLTYAFKLRPNVKWHDGQPFTAKDVRFSIETQKRLHARGRSTFANIERIETPDDLSITLHLWRPTPYLLTALSAVESPVVPQHVYGDADPMTHANNQAPIGTGPWKFKEWVRGSHIEWIRNDHYWDAPKPLAERLILKMILDPAAGAIALETGTVDIGYRTPVPIRDVARLRDNKKLVFEERGYEYDPPNIILIECNLQDPVLSNLKIRQAIAHCIDREAVCKVVFAGTAIPSATPVVPYLKEFHNPNPSPYRFNVAMAKKCLDEAGFPDKGGNRLTLTMDFFGDDQRLLAEFMRASLGRAGIGIELRGQDVGTLIKRVYGDRKFQLMLGQISNLFDPQVGVQRIYWSKNFKPGVAFSNGSSYSNPEVDALMEAAAISNAHQDRIAKWMAVQEIVMRDVPNICVAMPKWLTIANARLKDHTIDGHGFEGSFALARIVPG